MLVSMDVTSLYTNIPQKEGINIVSKTCEAFHLNKPPIPTLYLRGMLGLSLKENSFHFNGKNYLQTHGTAMGTKMAVSFANIFMAVVERKIIYRSHLKPHSWKRCSDDVFSLWNVNKEKINSFIELANSYHLTRKFTAEISDKETTFLDTCVRAKDLRKNPFSTCERTSNQQKLSNIHIFPPATLQVSGKALSKVKP